ncbi:MAG: sigma-54-dependent Fis family transcriptional regulator [Leptospiraceae bacterium]|nr:sigma-54-dependent Fis family transcriptional regulator [Leptospiraceae bacterium]MCP5511198.1 sigma-54-dependent Fis family transcriptional regulator [Leptospiraceae bacterium]
MQPITEQFELVIESFHNPIKAIQFIEKHHESISVIVTDFHMPEIDGVELIQRIERKDRFYQIIILTGGLNRKLTESFLHMNIFDLKEKDMPFYKILTSIRQAHQFYLNKIELNKRLSSFLVNSGVQENNSTSLIDDILTSNQKVKDIKSSIQKLKSSNANCLLTGESGTGKDMVIDAILGTEDRNSDFILMINCSEMRDREVFEKIISEEKLEVIEKSNSEVTIVLDEVSDLSLESQAYLHKILNTLMHDNKNSGKIRLIASTQKNLFQMTRENLFREDLYFLINVVGIELPPLRERKEDIQILFEYFLKYYSTQEKKIINDYERKIIRYFEDYYWPGNIRELKNVVHRMVLFSKSKHKLSVSEIPNEILDYSMQSLPNYKEEKEKISEELSIKNLEKITIEKALKKANYNKEMAARALGISRASIYRKMKEYGIKI